MISLAKLEKSLIKLIPFFNLYPEVIINKETIGELYTQVKQELIPKATDEQAWALYETFKFLENKKATPDNLRCCFYRIFSSLDQIKAGISPSYWTGNSTQAYLLVEHVSPAPSRNNKQYLILHLVCLAGEPAGLHFQVTLSRNLIEFILGKKLGVSFKKYNAPAEEIAGCIFKCNITEDVASASLSEYDANSYMKKHNQKLAEARVSLKKCKTPMLPCANCKKTRKECKLAVW